LDEGLRDAASTTPESLPLLQHASRLKPPCRLFPEQDLNQGNYGLGDVLELFERQRTIQVLVHHLVHSSSK
jgi:hypothetical protein